jgi:hypothetical protein
MIRQCIHLPILYRLSLLRHHLLPLHTRDNLDIRLPRQMRRPPCHCWLLRHWL